MSHPFSCRVFFTSKFPNNKCTSAYKHFNFLQDDSLPALPNGRVQLIQPNSVNEAADHCLLETSTISQININWEITPTAKMNK